ncbi:MAG: ATP-binding protein [Chloroflexi bacterium]|nr:ATP-binding protein [Chloroflexota bacterium]
MSTTQAKPAAANGKPQWMKNLTAMYQSGQAHAFILHYNVRDYVTNQVLLTEYLFRSFAAKPILVRYNIAEGIQFALPSMRAEFDKYTQDPNQPADPNAQALASLGLSAPNQTGPAPLPKSPASALPLLETLLRRAVDEKDGKLIGMACVVIEFAESIVPNAEIAMMSPEDRKALVTIERLGADPEISATGNPIILVTENLGDLNPAIRRSASKFEQIEIPLPTFVDRLTYLKARVDSFQLTLQDMTLESFASATAMLSRIHLEDICVRAAEGNDGVVTHDLIKERKQAIIAAEFGEVIEIMEPTFSFDDIGGLETVKEFFKDSVIDPILSGDKDETPMGVLMTGAAGTGKTIMAQAVAKESGINCVILNPAKLFGQYVGNTERNLDRALRAVVAMAPTIVFLDEIDQTINRGQGAGDSGVSNRFFKRLLEFMSNTTHRGSVVFLAATNRPDMMDAALKRPGRFDLKVPFFVPDDAQRVSIFQVMARRYGLGEIKPTTATILATNGWTGAEIEAATVKAKRLMRKEKLTPINALEQAAKRLRPSTADIEFMTMIALRECTDPDLLPPAYRNQIENREALDNKIADTKARATRTM